MQTVILENHSMNIVAGSLIKINDMTTGIYIVENNKTISTKNIHVKEGIYLVLETIGDKKNSYIEILYEENVVLISYIEKVCSLI